MKYDAHVRKMKSEHKVNVLHPYKYKVIWKKFITGQIKFIAQHQRCLVVRNFKVNDVFKVAFMM